MLDFLEWHSLPLEFRGDQLTKAGDKQDGIDAALLLFVVEVEDAVSLFGDDKKCFALAAAELLHDRGEGEDEHVLFPQNLFLLHAEHGEIFRLIALFVFVKKVIF